MDRFNAHVDGAGAIERKIAQSFTSRSYFKPCVRQCSEDNRCVKSTRDAVVTERPVLKKSVSLLESSSDSMLLEFDWLEDLTDDGL